MHHFVNGFKPLSPKEISMFGLLSHGIIRAKLLPSELSSPKGVTSTTTHNSQVEH